MKFALLILALNSAFAFANELGTVNGQWILPGGTRFQINNDGSFHVESGGSIRFFSRGHVDSKGEGRFVFHMDANPDDPCHVTISRHNGNSDRIGIFGTNGNTVSCTRLFKGEATRVIDGGKVESAGEHADESTSAQR